MSIRFIYTYSPSFLYDQRSYSLYFLYEQLLMCLLRYTHMCAVFPRHKKEKKNGHMTINN